MARSREWWDEWFLGLARYASTASKDPSTKVGAVIVDQDRRVVSMGYNGFPRGVHDIAERLADREFKYSVIVHAERNALIFARQDLRGCRVYTWPFMPCATCASMLVQAGVKEVVAPYSDNERWVKEFERAKIVLEEGGVALRLTAPKGVVQTKSDRRTKMCDTCDRVRRVPRDEGLKMIAARMQLRQGYPGCLDDLVGELVGEPKPKVDKKADATWERRRKAR